MKVRRISRGLGCPGAVAAIYKDLELPMHSRKLRSEKICRAEMLALWEEWRRIPDRARYGSVLGKYRPHGSHRVRTYLVTARAGSSRALIS